MSSSIQSQESNNQLICKQQQALIQLQLINCLKKYIKNQRIPYEPNKMIHYKDLLLLSFITIFKKIIPNLQNNDYLQVKKIRYSYCSKLFTSVIGSIKHKTLIEEKVIEKPIKEKHGVKRKRKERELSSRLNNRQFETKTLIDSLYRITFE
ncbi:hypothetical protein ABK040_003205 [Willaertia magna]